MKTVLQKFIILLICFFSFNANAQSSGVSIASINPPHGWIIIGNTYFPTISIHNDTTFNVDSIVISCFVNGTLIGTESYLPIITPNNTGQLFFSTSFMAVTGTNELCVTIDSVKGVATYDTLCVTLIGLPTLIPTYTDDFESANIGWLAVSADTKTNWELGTPNFGATNSANSGTSAWDINLTSGYDTSAHA